MNEFKFKQKEVVKDEDLLKYKNFNEVLNKHDQISKGYKSIVKIWGSIGLALLIGAIALFNTNPTPTDQVDNTPKMVTQNKMPVQTVSLKNKEVHPEVIEAKVAQPIVVQEKPTPPQDKIENTTIDKEPVIENTEDKIVVKSTQSLEEKYHLKYKTIEERVNLPTLYIGGQAWPKMVKKSDLVKKSNPTAYYREINQEVPIISYVMSKVSVDNPDLPSKKIHNQDGRFSAAILREVHRSNPGDLLIYKNIIAYIPGIGRMNLGDMKVEVVDDKLYQQRLREKKPVTE
jgi:hypothetical protein